MENLELKIGGMHCTGCSSRLEKVLNKIEGVSAKVSFENGNAVISYHSNKVNLDLIKEKVKNAGFEIL